MPQARVLVFDQFDSEGMERLKGLGLDVVLVDSPETSSLVDEMRRHDPETLIVGQTAVDASAIESGPSLRLLVCTGEHAESIDVQAASARGIAVATCPRPNALANAELAWSLLMTCDRGLVRQTTDLSSGQWKADSYPNPHGLRDRTLGVIGFSHVGQEIAARARQFGMQVLTWSPRSEAAEEAAAASVEMASSPEQLAQRSQFVVVHLRSAPQWAEQLGQGFCRALQSDSVLVITAGFAALPEQELLDAMEKRGVRIGLALDPIAEAKAMPSGAFLRARGVGAVHRLGAATSQARRAVAHEASEIVARYHRTGQPPHCVNRAATTPANTLLTIRMRNQPGVLAHVFYILGQAKVNVEEMENIIYEGHRAACARIQLDSALSEEMLNAIRANHAVISADCKVLERPAT